MGRNCHLACNLEIGNDVIVNMNSTIGAKNIELFNNNNQLANYLKQNMYGKKIVVGMGAGSISNWIKDLPNLMK
mgnify:CR=1 FL=1